MTEPRITVLIAAYNAARFIDRAIGSAQRQTIADIEIVVVDDASTDDTAATVQALAVDDPRIRLVALSVNGGPSAARNAGLDAARGDWVAVLDADDAFVPDRLATLLALADGADLVADNFSLYDAATGAVGPPMLPADPAVQDIDTLTFAAHAQTGADDWGLLKPMFRRAFLNAHGLRYDTASRHGEDFLFVLSILLVGGRYRRTAAAGYLYTTRASGFSRTLIDYGGMAEQTRRLFTRPDIARDTRLVALLTSRADALTAAKSRHEAVRLIAARDVIGLIRLGTSNSTARREIGRRLLRRFQR